MSANNNPPTSIEYLLENPFTHIRYKKGLKIVRAGRPRPLLASLQSVHVEKSRNYTRRFKESVYDRVPWLSGSETLQRLFCWPCVLFNPEKNVWNSVGYDNLNNLTTAIQKHERSQHHLSCSLSLKTFGVVRGERRGIERGPNAVEHNERVKGHRELLCRMVDGLCCVARQENGGDVEGNYVETLRLFGEYNPPMKVHLESGSVLWETPLHDVIRAVERMLLTAIRSEINNSRFVAVILEETGELPGRSRMGTILRYVTTTGETRERFVGLSDCSDKSPVDHVLGIVDEFGLHEKLVAQVYDGAAVRAEELGDTCERVGKLCPRAIFVHCHSHRLNRVLRQSVNTIKPCRMFFESLNRLVDFFSSSAKRSRRLVDFMETRLPRVPSKLWTSTPRLIETFCQYRIELVEFLEEAIGYYSDDWDEVAVVNARDLLASFTAFDVCFQQVVFAGVFSRTAELHDVLKTEGYDVGFCRDKAMKARHSLDTAGQRFDDVWRKVVAESAGNEQPLRKHAAQKIAYRTLYHEIIANVTPQVVQRLTSLNRILFVGLLDSNIFQIHLGHFPEELFINLQNTYPKMFDYPRLRNELVNLYKHEEFRDKPLRDLIGHMVDYGIEEVLTEVYKLSLLILTIPKTSGGLGGSCSMTERVRSYTRTKRGDADMSLLAIESSLLDELRKDPSFYQDVMAEYTRQGDRPQFTFQ